MVEENIQGKSNAPPQDSGLTFVPLIGLLRDEGDEPEERC